MRQRGRTSSPASMSFVDVLLNIGVLPAGKNITIRFDVTVDNPWQGATNQVSNQGTVSGTASPTCSPTTRPWAALPTRP